MSLLLNRQPTISANVERFLSFNFSDKTTGKSGGNNSRKQTKQNRSDDVSRSKQKTDHHADIVEEEGVTGFIFPIETESDIERLEGYVRTSPAIRKEYVRLPLCCASTTFYTQPHVSR